jgi:hypothetical protein
VETEGEKSWPLFPIWLQYHLRRPHLSCSLLNDPPRRSFPTSWLCCWFCLHVIHRAEPIGDLIKVCCFQEK